MLNFGIAGTRPRESGGEDLTQYGITLHRLEDLAVTPAVGTGGHFVDSFVKGGKTYQYHVFNGTAKFQLAVRTDMIVITITAGGGGGYQDATTVASGGGGGAVDIQRYTRSTAEISITVTAGGAAGTTSNNGKGGFRSSENIIGRKVFSGAGGASSLGATNATSVEITNSVGRAASDLSVGYWPAGGNLGGTTDTIQNDLECKLAGGSGGAGGPGFSASKASRRGGAGGPGADLTAYVPTFNRRIYGCGGAGGAVSVDGLPVYPGIAAPGGAAQGEAGAANSGCGGGPGANGGSGRVIILYRIA